MSSILPNIFCGSNPSAGWESSPCSCLRWWRTHDPARPSSQLKGPVALARLLPVDVAKELTFTGRIVPGIEAAAIGLVTRTADDPLAATLALADEIA